MITESISVKTSNKLLTATLMAAFSLIAFIQPTSTLAQATDTDCGTGYMYKDSTRDDGFTYAVPGPVNVDRVLIKAINDQCYEIQGTGTLQDATGCFQANDLGSGYITVIDRFSPQMSCFDIRHVEFYAHVEASPSPSPSATPEPTPSGTPEPSSTPGPEATPTPSASPYVLGTTTLASTGFAQETLAITLGILSILVLGATAYAYYKH